VQIKNGNAVNFNFEPRTYYVVEVSLKDCNPLHRAIFYSGFLDDKTKRPMGYACVWNALYDGDHTQSVHFMDVVSKIEVGQCGRVLKPNQQEIPIHEIQKL